MLRVAAIQISPPHGRVEEARALLCARVQEAVQGGARLVVCPEMSTTGYVWRSRDEIAPFLESADGPTFVALSEIARASGARVMYGFAERAGKRAYNSAMVIGARGERLGVYRKMLLFSLDETWTEPGDRRQLYVLGGRTVAPSLCADMNDDGFRAFVDDRSPQIVALMANWLDEGVGVHPYWRWRLRPWRGWIVAANRWGSERGIDFRGTSAVIAPDGDLVALAGTDGDAIVMADLPIGGAH